MAPNLKHIQQTPITFRISGSKLVQPVARDYQVSTESTEPPQDSASYWSWPSKPVSPQADESSPAVCTALERIESNLRRFHEPAASNTKTSSDDYWAEETHACCDEREDYWLERNYSKSDPQIDSDTYWDTSAHVPPVPTRSYPVATVRSASVNPSWSDAYWMEQVHVPTASDTLWRESKPVESADGGGYWNWSAKQQPVADSYWNWPSVKA